ncbi:hypothetical protein DTO013E5_378 [Penicillium roqueforti]|uniref:Genomic scaffold, ProqFM164S02 n=1 Tax=Penicillium roqueforti (strain FM164) TaxID=1365484 RepID=W6Q323_PENRF|nr:uncharacterized protein LCP9604111_760 [Penicillium roqueforti]CDM30978.1 unnamed protein product [Penicillium roqueforti FM164]KAF9253234.1 hypothetical protein LCP9604111_760 [Penicillium roqueforti]KAI1838750.1 hypothetical protein CBS147337_475 [Penicillium roqueforti]KAI2680360.1 hypothetical protein CBS147355_3340 [Penicillium roqueforti]KAI2691251.1 hypothetical protein LCP963914a_1452 [Penicillium roqueforti]
METVTKYVNAASTAIWGENDSNNAQQHGEEPASGVQGQGRITDPYDGGNRDEQPGAIHSNANTAPLNAHLDNNQSKPEVTSITTPHAPSSLTACTSITPALPVSDGPTADSEDKETKPISSGSIADSESKEKKPVSNDSTESTGSNDDNSSKQEQRSTSQAEGGESSEAPHTSRTHDVSKEALKGPQGPAPTPAEDFEKEYRGKKPAAEDEDIETNSPSESSGKSPLKPERSPENGEKNGKLSKVKESVKKHLHHSSK